METENMCKKYNVLNELFETSDKSLHVIKSNLMLRIKMLAKEQGSEVDTGQTCCEWCFNTWLPGKYSVTLKPQKHPKKSMRSLLKKDITTLNKFQHKLVSKIKKSTTANTLVINCLICLKNTHIPLRNENAKSKKREVNSTTECLQAVPRKQKKKKKDIFAGLNSQAVLQYRKSSGNETNKKSKSAKQFSKKSCKEISFKHQLRIHQALLKMPIPKKKPSQLAKFLDNM